MKTIYQVVYGVSLATIEDKVNSYLEKGWKLRGGVATLSIHYVQAMTKSVKEICKNCNGSGKEKVQGEDYYDVCSFCDGAEK